MPCQSSLEKLVLHLINPLFDDRMAANGSSNGNGSHAHKTGLEVTCETREALKSTSFDVWKYEDSEEVGVEGRGIQIRA